MYDAFVQHTFRLFGTPQIYFEGEWQHLAKNQLTLLAAYLAFSKDWVSRDEVIFRFWPDVPEVKARRNLNQLAYQLKNEKWAGPFEATPTHLRFDVVTDLQNFREAVSDDNWAKASRAYKEELISGAYRNVPVNFEIWLDTERQSVARAWRDLGYQHAKSLVAQGNYDVALELLETILEHNFLDETILQFYLTTALKAGQAQKALQTFELFHTELTTELSLEPTSKTMQLFEQLKSEELSETNALSQLASNGMSSNAQHVESNKINVPQYNIPKFIGSFVGRQTELEQLEFFFEQTDCCLITIIGWGGMGKTRLAVAAMRQFQHLYKDGIAFIALQSLSSETEVIHELIRVLELNFQKNINLKQQLLSWIADKQMLILFDNFEHLIDQSETVSDLLKASEQLQIVVTSREALNYQGEQLLELRGLDHPKQTDDDDFEQYDSIQLFLQIAKRTGAFEYSLDNRLELLQICELLEGMPLAIELAAQWCRFLSLPEIVKELRRDLDFLEGSQKDRPDRQKSMRRVFNYSWQLLSTDEQEAMLKLAILKGAFPKEAAQAIADVSLRSLFSLINKSVLKQQNGYLTRHPLVYEFTFEKLLNSDQHETLQLRHANYYYDLAQNLNKEKSQTFVDLRLSHQNITATLDYLRQTQLQKALRFLCNLERYWELRASYKEITDCLNELLHQYDQKDELRAESCLLLAKHLVWQSLWEVALNALNESYALAKQLKLNEVKADALHSLGQFHFFQSHYSEAKTYYEQSLALYRRLSHEEGEAQSLTSLGVIAKDQGHYELAKQHYEESLEIRRRFQDQHGVATALNNLGIIAKDQGDYDSAIDLYQQSLSIREELQDQRGTAQCLLNIGLIEINRENYPVAKEFLEKSIGIEQSIGNVYGVSLCLNTLANLAIDQKRFQEAEELLKEGLKLKEQLGDLRGIAFSKHSMGFLRREQDNYVGAAKNFKHSLGMFRDIADQRGCLLVIADSITLFAAIENIKSYSYFQSCEALCQHLNICLAPRTWNKTQQRIQAFRARQTMEVLSSDFTLNDLVSSCERELELLLKPKN